MPITINAKQLEALRIYANTNGRTWKSKLRQDWQRALYLSVPEVYWPELQQVRGIGGTWLEKFKFPPEQPKGSFPLTRSQAEEFFADLETAVVRLGCDGSRRLAEAWLAQHDLDVEKALRWLAEHGGFCDCEVLLNAQVAYEKGR